MPVSHSYVGLGSMAGPPPPSYIPPQAWAAGVPGYDALQGMLTHKTLCVHACYTVPNVTMRHSCAPRLRYLLVSKALAFQSIRSQVRSIRAGSCTSIHNYTLSLCSASWPVCGHAGPPSAARQHCCPGLGGILRSRRRGTATDSCSASPSARHSTPADYAFLPLKPGCAARLRDGEVRRGTQRRKYSSMFDSTNQRQVQYSAQACHL